MIDERERTSAREQWERLLRQHRRMVERLEFIDRHPDHPEIDDLSAKSAMSTARYGELHAELAEWAGTDPVELDALLAEVLAVQATMAGEVA